MNQNQSSFIPEKVFNDLPRLLAEPCATFKDKRERDVFLVGALAVLSACLPNTSGIYDRKIYYPNLYTFISAPPANGKGVLKLAKELGMARHRLLVLKSREAREKYQEAMRAYDISLTKYRQGVISDPPIEPETELLKMLFIPANTRSPILVQQLKNNGNQGILFESDAGVLSSYSKQDWGRYSDI